MKKIYKLTVIAVVAVTVTALLTVGVSASGLDIGTNAGKWLIDQAKWLFLAATILGTGYLGLIKKSASGAVTCLVIGGIVTFLCAFPNTITWLGEQIAGILGIGAA